MSTFNQQSAFHELAIGGKITNKVWDDGNFIEFEKGVLVDQTGNKISPSALFADDGYMVFDGEKNGQ